MSLSKREIELGVPLESHDILEFINGGLRLKGSSRVMVVRYEDLDKRPVRWYMKKTATILYFSNPEDNVGHYTLLLPVGDVGIEYMDSMGGQDPDATYQMMHGMNPGVWSTMMVNTKKLSFIPSLPQMQKGYSNVCGKYCISRIMARRDTQSDWAECLIQNEKFTPDHIVNVMYEIPVHDLDGVYLGAH